jgi:3-oxoacyl-[acyl-carrier protein] reductase
VVLITGASRGIGKACALEFAKNGYDVAINYVNDDISANAVVDEIKKLGVNSIAIKCDISNETSVKEMVDTAIEKFGRIDVLVNNAGIAIDTTFEDKTKENFMRTLEVNLVGTFLVSKEVGKYMKNGSIVNVSSTNGIDTVYPESLDYDASKAGVISLTKNLAIEYAPNIRVNTVAPGWVLTDMNKELDYEFVKREEEKILLNRFADPEEIAKVIYFVAAEATYMNGSVIRVDGGVNNV